MLIFAEQDIRLLHTRIHVYIHFPVLSHYGLSWGIGLHSRTLLLGLCCFLACYYVSSCDMDLLVLVCQLWWQLEGTALTPRGPHASSAASSLAAPEKLTHPAAHPSSFPIPTPEISVKITFSGKPSSPACPGQVCLVQRPVLLLVCLPVTCSSWLLGASRPPWLSRRPSGAGNHRCLALQSPGCAPAGTAGQAV